jgi:hypothetical protein
VPKLRIRHVHSAKFAVLKCATPPSPSFIGARFSCVETCALGIGADSSVPVRGQSGAFAPTTRKMPIPKRAKIVEISEKSKKNLAPEPTSEILRTGFGGQVFFSKKSKKGL